MKAVVRTIFFVLTCFSTQVMADAPVVDDSENFALLEEQIQVADEELPVAHDSYTIRADDSEVTFARDVAQNTTTSNTDLVNKIQSLQREIQDLRGQVEVQAHELNDLKQQQLSFYQDIDTRLNQHNAVASAAKPQAVAPQENTDTASAATQPALTQAATDVQLMPTTTSAAARLNPADEQISYLAAYDLIKQKQFPQASLAMQQFLSKYPRGGYSANAHYWLGELYLVNKDYANAITQFDSVIQNFKSSSKYAPSRLKMGYALADTGRISEAKQQLLAVINHYPDTSTARLAHAKLEALGG
ncbi:MAG: tol-pal system protein YbgF [Gammaproteobacteria bacterium]|nr:tol-pal system protein YbgF [Gammaproteobacteria bacterium]